MYIWCINIVLCLMNLYKNLKTFVLQTNVANKTYLVFTGVKHSHT